MATEKEMKRKHKRKNTLKMKTQVHHLTQSNMTEKRTTPQSRTHTQIMNDSYTKSVTQIRKPIKQRNKMITERINMKILMSTSIQSQMKNIYLSHKHGMSSTVIATNIEATPSGTYVRQRSTTNGQKDGNETKKQDIKSTKKNTQSPTMYNKLTFTQTIKV